MVWNTYPRLTTKEGEPTRMRRRPVYARIVLG